jgi:non-ribosomal peptide synthetase component F
MVLLAALDVVLARWSGQDEVVVGTPVAGRTRAETERMIGLFLNSLALRIDLSGGPTFGELLRRVREATLEAYANQDVPFERVLEEVRPERSLAHSPVFQVMLNLANFGEGELRLPGIESTDAAGGGDPASKFDLTLYAGETEEGGLYLHLVYDADLFDAPRMRELLAQVAAVLAAGAADPARPVALLPLRPAGAALLPDPAARLPIEPWTGGVSERVAARAWEAPEAAAVEDPRERWSYRELDAAANRIARRLVRGGLRPGDTVAVWAHRSAPLVRALLGAWRAGGAFVVLDPAYPAARLARTVRLARPAALLRVAAAGEPPAEVAAALAESAATTLLLGAREGGEGAEGVDGLAEEGAGPLPLAVDPDGLAYLAFTSGTTGVPKGIEGTHRPLSHFFAWYAAELGVGTRDRVSVLGGLAHDPLLRDLFAPLWCGGTAVFPDPEEMGTPGYLAEWARDRAVTVAHLTPATGELVAESAAGVRLPRSAWPASAATGCAARRCAPSARWRPPRGW